MTIAIVMLVDCVPDWSGVAALILGYDGVVEHLVGPGHAHVGLLHSTVGQGRRQSGRVNQDTLNMNYLL